VALSNEELSFGRSTGASGDIGGFMLEYVIVGFLSLVVGLFSLSVDPKTDKKKAALMVGALVLSAFFTGMYGYKDSTDAKTQTESLLANEKELKTNLQTLMRREGIPGTEEGATAQPAASAAPSAHATPSTPSTPPIIEYFAKDNEGDGVTRALRDHGLDVIKLPGQIPGPTNSLWAGNGVTIAEVKPIALTLLRAGVQLKAVRHFRDGSGSKERLIEIGSDQKFATAPVLTEEQIQNMTDLPTR
jgi:hypothetical protein